MTVNYGGQWWLACIVDANHETREVEVNFLHLNGLSNSFLFPEIEDHLTLDVSDILQSVEPRTAVDRMYTLTKKEATVSTKALKAKK